MEVKERVIADLSLLDLTGTIIAALLTIMILSYLVRDNVLFRVAVFLFVGVASGYAGSIAWHNVLQPGLVTPLREGEITGLFTGTGIVTLVIPWLLVVMLMLKVSPKTARFGGLPLALLVGVGAAVLVGGAITGTLIPQSVAAMDTLRLDAVAPLTGESGLERVANVIIMLVGTISTLIYFRFSARRDPAGGTSRTTLTAVVAYVGRGFIALTFGVMYAGALTATVIVLAERVQFLMSVVSGIFSG